MSAIWGAWRRDGGDLTPDVAECARSSLARYGPGHLRFWNGTEAALGCALAPSLVEDRRDSQPLYASGDSSVIVADSRIDNRRELWDDLSISPDTAEKMADSSLLQTAWNRWGEGCMDRLVGDFAFAVWNPVRRRMICVRDHLGNRPLHYIDRGSLFAFASLPAGLLSLPGVPREVDQTMIATRLALLPEAGERSFFRGIKRLPPGHLLIADPDGIRVHEYWRPDVRRRIVFSRDADYVENFRHIFDEAVRCRMRSPGLVGSLLSGGFDSTSVTATAARLLGEAGQSLTAFTGVPAAGFEEAGPKHSFGNEGPHAASVAAQYPNIRHVLVEPAGGCFLDFLGNLRSWTGTPGGHPVMAPSRHAMTTATRERGVRTVLSGSMGNLTISYDGASLLPGLIRQGRWFRWAQEVAGVKRARPMSLRGVLLNSFGPFIPDLPGWAKLNGGRFDPLHNLHSHSMIHPGLLASGGVRELAESFRRETRTASREDGRSLRVSPSGAATLALCMSAPQ